MQDLSQLELALIGKLPTPSGELVSSAENALFLAGDGAQTIYKRGFSLRTLGIDVNNRSVTLKKNYRNTHEIPKAAFGLVARYEFADVDEEDVVRPSEPEFAKRHGARPTIIRCSSLPDEAATVAASLQTLLANGRTPGQICVVGPSVKTREEVQLALDRLNIDYTPLREDADYESERVKVSTIESAKGHEFGDVFIMGLVEGVLPKSGLADSEIPREAARLYVDTRTREPDDQLQPLGAFAASRFLLAIQDDCDEKRIRSRPAA